MIIKVFADLSQSSGGSPTHNKGRFIGLGDSPRGVGDSPARGPSASSTPNRSRKGSIVDELKVFIRFFFFKDRY